MIRYAYSGKGFEPFEPAIGKYDREFLVSLLWSMMRIRMVQEEMERRYREDEMKTPIHLVIGQEATSVGCCAALERKDQVFSGHRTNGNYLAKGGDLKAMMSELYCRANGCVASRGGSMHLLDKEAGYAGSSGIVAGSLPIATGAALAARMLKQDWATMVFFGDAATEEGTLWESLNYAALRELPVIYVCENNFFSVCSPLEARQPKVEIYEKAASFGLHSVQVDGTNVLEVYETARSAVERARSGKGPTFIESLAYRWRGHGGAGDDSDTGYRDPAEVEHWKQYCPIEGFYNFLAKRGQIDEPGRNALVKQIQNEVLKAFEHAISSPVPEESDLFKHVYSD
ncbi:MAG: thiamine pyrophosphate-dependent dehydrogenase E1 component subunit alpha [Nitrospinae bacterium]|nr:thiamine pyrophosphate-dependent dehydrogenase E1 component subunit alpha [Nitrospinota bacterium]